MTDSSPSAPGDAEHAFRRPARSVRTVRAAGDVRESHGGRRLATGIGDRGAFIVLAHLFARPSPCCTYSRPRPRSVAAWIVLAVIVGVVGVIARSCRADCPTGSSWCSWPASSRRSGSTHRHRRDARRSASSHGRRGGCGGADVVATVRGSRIPLVAATAIGAVLAAARAHADRRPPASRRRRRRRLSAVSARVLVRSLAISGFRRLVQVASSTCRSCRARSARSRSAVGMRASEELARLDFAAEKLLDDVGSGRHLASRCRPTRPNWPARSPPRCACTSSRAAARPGCTTRSPSPSTSATGSPSTIQPAPPGCSPGAARRPAARAWLLVTTPKRRGAAADRASSRCRERTDESDPESRDSHPSRRRECPATCRPGDVGRYR